MICISSRVRASTPSLLIRISSSSETSRSISAHLGLGLAGHLGSQRRKAAPGCEVRRRTGRVALNQGVAEQPGGNPLHIGSGECTFEQILHRIIDTLAIGKRTTGQVGDRFAGGAPYIVGYAGTEADLHGKVETGRQRQVNAPDLDNRVAERTACGLRQLILGKRGINGIDIYGRYFCHRKIAESVQFLV